MACEMAGVGVYSSPRRDHHLDAVGGQHFERAGERRRRQRVRVEADEQRAVDALLPAVLADRLGDGEHVALVEAHVERAAAMAGSAEGHPLRRDCRIRALACSTP